MPFDGRSNLDTQTLHRTILADALRAEMPKGFTWDFGSYGSRNECGTAGCAIGLANSLWPEAKIMVNDHMHFKRLQNLLGMSHEQIMYIFHRSGGAYGSALYHDITPAMVADRLEETLKLDLTMDKHWWADHIARMIVNLLIDLPITVFSIGGILKWSGFYESFNLPTPTWTQAWGIGLVMLCLGLYYH